MITLAAAAQDREFEYRRVLTEGLIAASVQATEASQQIRYYEDLLNNISAGPVGVASSDVSTRLTAVHQRLIKSVDRLQELSQAVSAQVLNPSRRLYSVTTPPRLQTAPAISTRLLLIRLSLTLIVTFIVAVAACLLHGSRPAATAAAAEGSFEARA